MISLTWKKIHLLLEAGTLIPRCSLWFHFKCGYLQSYHWRHEFSHPARCLLFPNKQAVIVSKSFSSRMASLGGSGGERAADPPKATSAVCRLHPWRVQPDRRQEMLEEPWPTHGRGWDVQWDHPFLLVLNFVKKIGQMQSSIKTWDMCPITEHEDGVKNNRHRGSWR